VFWWWGPGGGAWWWGLINLLFLITIVVVAVVVLREDIPGLHRRYGEPPALRLLEERYARGEIGREEFLERRRVLLETPTPQPSSPMPGQAAGPPAGDPTQPIPPMPEDS
jgi:putative membrane protein